MLSPPKGGYTVDGRPVLNLSLAINYAIGGIDVTGYHVGNILIHTLVALTLFGVVRRTLLLASIPQSLNRWSTGIAFAVALLWAVHPLQTESVTYVVQRAESIMGLLYLLTLYCLIRGATAARQWPWLAAMVAACAVGMASKEVMVSAPLAVLLYDRAFLSGSFLAAIRRRWLWYAGLAATWVILVYLVVEAGTRGQSAGARAGISRMAYALTQPEVVVHYLKLAFWPRSLCLDYYWAPVRSAKEALPGIIVIGALLALTIGALVLRPRWGFVGACFFMLLAPSSSIIPLADVAFEHRMYLPLAAVVGVVVLLAVLGWERLTGRRRGDVGLTPSRWLAPALVLGVVAVGLGWRSFIRNQDYSSHIRMFQDIVKKRPANPRARGNLGTAYQLDNRLPEALEQFNAAIALRPNFGNALHGRGVTHAQLGEFEKAIEDLTRAIELMPKSPQVYNDRGNAFSGAGRLEEAMQDYGRAVCLRADYAEPHFSRGVIRMRRREYDTAIADFTRAIELWGGRAHPYNNRGVARMETGQPELAVQDFTSAIRLQPVYPEAYANRAISYARLGRYEEAAADDTTAIVQRPGTPEPYSHRASMLCNLGRLEEARRDAEACLHLGGRVSATLAAKLGMATQPAVDTASP